MAPMLVAAPSYSHIAIGELAKQKRIPIAGCYHKSHSLNRRLHNLTDKQTNELAIAFELELNSLEKEKQTEREKTLVVQH